MARRADQFAAFAPFLLLRAFQMWSSVVLLNPVLFLYGVKRALLIYATEFVAHYIQFVYAHMFSLGWKNLLFNNPDGVEPVMGNWIFTITMDVVVVLLPIIGTVILYSKFWSDLNDREETEEESRVGGFIWPGVLWANFMFFIM